MSKSHSLDRHAHNRHKLVGYIRDNDWTQIEFDDDSNDRQMWWLVHLPSFLPLHIVCTTEVVRNPHTLHSIGSDSLDTTRHDRTIGDIQHSSIEKEKNS